MCQPTKWGWGIKAHKHPLFSFLSFFFLFFVFLFICISLLLDRLCVGLDFFLNYYLKRKYFAAVGKIKKNRLNESIIAN